MYTTVVALHHHACRPDHWGAGRGNQARRRPCLGSRLMTRGSSPMIPPLLMNSTSERPTFLGLVSLSTNAARKAKAQWPNSRYRGLRGGICALTIAAGLLLGAGAVKAQAGEIQPLTSPD